MPAPKALRSFSTCEFLERLELYPEEAREVDAIYCFKITGDGGGEWTVDLSANPPAIDRGDTGTAQCTIEVAADDFKTMLGSPQVGMELYFQGKLRISGDPMLASKLERFFELVGRDTGA